jgi:hypothetical protein
MQDEATSTAKRHISCPACRKVQASVAGALLWSTTFETPFTTGLLPDSSSNNRKTSMLLAREASYVPSHFLNGCHRPGVLQNHGDEACVITKFFPSRNGGKFGRNSSLVSALRLTKQSRAPLSNVLHILHPFTMSFSV